MNKNRKVQGSIIVFGITVLIMLIIFSNRGIFPFGDKSILISDMNNQYVHFLNAYKSKILEGNGFLHGWDSLTGNKLIALYATYLGSPLNLILLLVPTQYMLEGILILTLIKVGLASVSCYLFLNVLKKHARQFILVVLSLCYGLMMYVIINAMNIMWLDAVIILPICLIGIHNILQENKYIIFTYALIYLFISNYYIAYMVGIFLFIYFTSQVIINYSMKDYKKGLINYITFFKGTFIAIGCSSIIIIPTYFSIMQEGILSKINLSDFKFTYSFFELLTPMFLGSVKTIKTNGLPHIYVGLIVIYFVCLYFYNPLIKLKEKVVHGLLIIMIMISMNLEITNLIWHAMEVPSWFEYRYSFIIAIIFIILACKNLESWQGISRRILTKSYIVLNVIYLLLASGGYEHISVGQVVLTLLFLLIYYVILLIGIQLSKKSRYSITILIVVILELVLNGIIGLQRVNLEVEYRSRQDYIQNRQALEESIKNVKGKDDSFYRIEKDFRLSYNDSLNLGYNGISYFSTSSNREITELLKKMGLRSPNLNAVAYEGQTLITDSLFSVKYFLTKGEDIKGYKPIKRFNNEEDIRILENPYWLPIAFEVDKDILGLELTEVNPILLQESILKSMIGNKEISYFEPISIKEYKLEEDKVIRLNLDDLEATSIYVYIDSENLNDISLKLGNQEIKNPTKITHLNVEDAQKELTITLNNENIRINNINVYAFNIESFQQTISKLRESSIKVASYTSNSISGQLTSSKDDTILYTSIPYDESWHIKLNGKEVEGIKILGGFLGVNLPEKENYSIEFTFIPKGLYVGSMISAISIIGLVVISVKQIFYIKKNKN